MAKHSLSRNESLMLRHLSEIISYKVGDPSLGLPLSVRLNYVIIVMRKFILRF